MASTIVYDNILDFSKTINNFDSNSALKNNILDHIDFINIRYDNIAFDPRIRFCIDRINSFISEYTVLDVEHFNGNINIIGLDKLIKVPGSCSELKITNTSIVMDWTYEKEQVDIHIALELEFTDGYLYHCHYYVWKDILDKSVDVVESASIVYGKDLTLKYLHQKSSDPTENVINDFVLTNGNIFHTTSNPKYHIKEYIGDNINVAMYYNFPYKLSQKNIMLVYATEDFVGNRKDCIKVYAVYGDHSYYENIPENTVESFLKNMTVPVTMKKQSINNFIFDTYFQTKNVDIGPILRQFTIGTYSGEYYSNFTFDSDIHRINIKNNGNDFFNYENIHGRETGPARIATFSIHSPVTSELILKVNAQYKLSGDFSRLKIVTSDIICNKINTHVHEFTGNPLLNINDATIIDEEFILKINYMIGSLYLPFNVNETVNQNNYIYKLPIETLFGKWNNISVTSTGLVKKSDPNNIIMQESSNGKLITYKNITPPMYTYGSTFSKKAIVKKTVKDESTKKKLETTKMTVNMETGDIVDEFSVVYGDTSKYYKKNRHVCGSIGYKACVGPDLERCIVKLYIYPESKIATDSTGKKFRTNRCKVLDIAVTNNGQIIEDFRYKMCCDCGMSTCTKQAMPCRHLYCEKCIYLTKDSTCKHCKNEIITMGEIILDKEIPERKKCSLTVAYSFITSKTTRYEIGTDVVINNFDIDLEKKCSEGIHYHENIADTYQWFEFLDIPQELQQSRMDEINIFDVQPNLAIDRTTDYDNAAMSHDHMQLHKKMIAKQKKNIIEDELENATGIRHRSKKSDNNSIELDEPIENIITGEMKDPKIRRHRKKD